MSSWIASLPFLSSPKKGDSDMWITKEPVVQKGCTGHDSETSIMWSEAPGNGSFVVGCNSPCSKFPRKVPALEGLLSISLQDEDVCASPPGKAPCASPTRGRRLCPSYFISKSLSVRNILSPRRDKVEGCEKADGSGLLLPFRVAPTSNPTTQSTMPSDQQVEPISTKLICGNGSQKDIEIDFRDLIETRDEVAPDTCETSATPGQGVSLRSRLHRSISEFFSSRSEMKCEINLDDIFETKNQGALEPASKSSLECSSADSNLFTLHRSMSEIFSSRLSGSRAPVAKEKNQSNAEAKFSPSSKKLASLPRPSPTEPTRRNNQGSIQPDLHRSMSEVFSSRSGRCDPNNKQRAKSSSTAKPKNHKDSKQRMNRGTPDSARKGSSSERQRAQRRHSMPTYNAEAGLQDLLEAYDMIMSMNEQNEATVSEKRNESHEHCSSSLDTPDPDQDHAVESSNQMKNTSQLHDDTTVTLDDDVDDDDDDDDDDQNVSYLRPMSRNGTTPHEKPTSRRLERGLSLLDEKDEEATTAQAKYLQSHSSLFESTGW